MQGLRAILRTWLKHHAHYHEKAHPQPRDVDTVDRLLKTFLSLTKKTNKLRASVIRSLVNGDPAAFELHHWCVGPRCCLSKDHYHYKMNTFFTAAVCGTCPPKWPRHRWIGMDYAVDYYGLLEGINHIWSQVFPIWCSVQRGKPLPGIGPAGPALGEDVLAPSAVEDVLDVGAKADLKMEELALKPAEHRPLAQAIDFKRQQQASTRSKALTWTLPNLRYDLFGVLASVRLCMEPLRLVMDSYITRSGEDHDVRKIQKEANAVKRETTTGRSNLSRLLAAHHGEHTKDAWSTLLHTMQSGFMWGVN